MWKGGGGDYAKIIISMEFSKFYWLSNISSLDCSV